MNLWHAVLVGVGLTGAGALAPEAELPPPVPSGAAVQPQAVRPHFVAGQRVNIKVEKRTHPADGVKSVTCIVQVDVVGAKPERATLRWSVKAIDVTAAPGVEPDDERVLRAKAAPADSFELVIEDGAGVVAAVQTDESQNAAAQADVKGDGKRPVPLDLGAFAGADVFFAGPASLAAQAKLKHGESEEPWPLGGPKVALTVPMRSRADVQPDSQGAGEVVEYTLTREIPPSAMPDVMKRYSHEVGLALWGRGEGPEIPGSEGTRFQETKHWRVDKATGWPVQVVHTVRTRFAEMDREEQITWTVLDGSPVTNP